MFPQSVILIVEIKIKNKGLQFDDLKKMNCVAQFPF